MYANSKGVLVPLKSKAEIKELAFAAQGAAYLAICESPLSYLLPLKEFLAIANKAADSAFDAVLARWDYTAETINEY